MLTTQQKTLRKFWYATVRLDALHAGPLPFRLMGEDIVLFLGPDGQPAALADRCCHRTAKLSKGWVDEGRIQLVQSLYRNDTEADCPAEMLIEWDRAIITEDREVLESTSPDAILDVSRRVEQHMPSDQPGMVMREHGEEEVTRAYA